MKRYETDDLNSLEFRSSVHWFLTFAGLLFLIPGLVVGTAFFWDKGYYSPKDIAFSFAWGGIFTAIGVPMVFLRKGRRINRRTMIVRSWWGLLFPLRSKNYDITSIKHVSIEHQSGGEDSDTYPVRIIAIESILIDDPTEYMRARQLAVSIAKFLSTGIVDSSSTETVTHGAETIGLSLKEKAEYFSEDIKIPDQPDGIKSEITREGDQLSIVMPAAELGREAAIAIFVVGIFASFPGIIALFISGLTGKWLAMSKVLFIIMPFGLTVGALWFVYLYNLVVRCKVTVSKHELTVEKISPFRKKQIEIPLAELEELVLLKDYSFKAPVKLLETLTAQPIIARSDTCEASFGKHLPRAERVYLLTILQQSIGG